MKQLGIVLCVVALMIGGLIAAQEPAVPSWVDVNQVPYGLFTHTVVLGDALKITISDEFNREMAYEFTEIPNGESVTAMVDGKYVLTFKPATVGVHMFQLNHRVLLPFPNRRRRHTIAINCIDPEYGSLMFHVDTIPDPCVPGGVY